MKNIPVLKFAATDHVSAQLTLIRIGAVIDVLGQIVDDGDSMGLSEETCAVADVIQAMIQDALELNDSAAPRVEDVLNYIRSCTR